MVNNKLNTIFSSLADPTRRDILQRLLDGELSVNELAKAYDMSLPAVSKHLRVLETANLIKKERRGRQHFIRLVEHNFQDAADYLLYYQTVLNKRLDSLDRYIQKGMAPMPKQKKHLKHDTDKQTLVMTHVFDAPLEKVWDAYTDPRHVSEWWGPKNTNVLGCYNDVRVGGMWRFAFRGAAEQDYIVSGTYKKVDNLKKLVYSDGFGEADSDRPEALVTVKFTQLSGGKTELTKTSVAPRTVHQLQAAWLKAAEGF